jgi:hypothetical protein
MKMRNGILGLAMIFLTAAMLLAGDFSGRWKGKLLVNGNEMPGYLILKQDGEKLLGTAGPDAEKQVKLEKGMMEGDKATIDVRPGGAVLGFVLRLEDDKLVGDVFEDGNKIGTAIFLRVAE